MLAVIEIDTRLLTLLSLQDELCSKRPERMSESKPLITKALQTVLNAHKRNACTFGQIEELERLIGTVKGLTE